MTEHKDRIEHTLEVLVYAPIGVGLYLKDMGPTFVNMFVARGRAEIDRRQAQVQQRTTTAKSIGQVAMTFGVPMVRQRVEREVDSARQHAQSFLGSIGGIDTPGSSRHRRPRAAARTKARRRPTGPRPQRARRPPHAATTEHDKSAPRLRTNGAITATRAAATVTRCRSPATTRSRHRRWSSGSPDFRRPSSTPCAPTKARTATAARFSARSTRSPRRASWRTRGSRRTTTSTRVEALAHDFRAELLEERGGHCGARARPNHSPTARAARRPRRRDPCDAEAHIVGYGTARIEHLARRRRSGSRRSTCSPRPGRSGSVSCSSSELVAFCVRPDAPGRRRGPARHRQELLRARRLHRTPPRDAPLGERVASIRASGLTRTVRASALRRPAQ